MTRIEKLRLSIDLENGAAIVQSDSNRAYLASFISSAGTILITKCSAFLFLDSRYYELAKKTVQGIEIVLIYDLYSQITEILQTEKINIVLIENETTIGRLASTKKGFKKAKVKLECSNTLSKAILSLRETKDTQEIDEICKAQAITDLAFAYICGFIKVGVTEREIAAELEYVMKKNGADGFAFSTICVSGKNSSMPHGMPSDKKVEIGDFITMDFGARVNGYCSDMTRTVSVGEPSAKQIDVYKTVQEAKRRAISASRAGVSGEELDAVAREYIKSCGYGDYFLHGLGHSLGIDVHEQPRASRGAKNILKENTVITIEPGIYIDGEFGVRIEDMIRITKDGAENLTKSSSELIVLQ